MCNIVEPMSMNSSICILSSRMHDNSRHSYVLIAGVTITFHYVLQLPELKRLYWLVA